MKKADFCISTGIKCQITTTTSTTTMLTKTTTKQTITTTTSSTTSSTTPSTIITTLMPKISTKLFKVRNRIKQTKSKRPPLSYKNNKKFITKTVVYLPESFEQFRTTTPFTISTTTVYYLLNFFYHYCLFN